MDTLPARLTHPHAELPTRAHPTDAGLDLAASETTHIGEWISVLAMRSFSESGSTAPILTSASSAALAIAAPPKARTMRAPATSATISSRVNISGGRSKPSLIM